MLSLEKSGHHFNKSENFYMYSIFRWIKNFVGIFFFSHGLTKSKIHRYFCKLAIFEGLTRETDGKSKNKNSTKVMVPIGLGVARQFKILKYISKVVNWPIVTSCIMGKTVFYTWPHIALLTTFWMANPFLCFLTLICCF